MNYDDKIATGLRDLDDARRFQELFPDAEHAIVQAKHDFDPDGWQVVDEWISRVALYDRYALWLVMPIEFTSSGRILSLETPEVYIIELKKVEKSKAEKNGPKWECNFGKFEDGDWEELVRLGGDFEAMEADLTTDAPVERFDTFWRDTTPPPEAPAPDGLALASPLRFMAKEE